MNPIYPSTAATNLPTSFFGRRVNFWTNSGKDMPPPSLHAVTFNNRSEGRRNVVLRPCPAWLAANNTQARNDLVWQPQRDDPNHIFIDMRHLVQDREYLNLKHKP